jgi:hypothetical protein
VVAATAEQVGSGGVNRSCSVQFRAWRAGSSGFSTPMDLLQLSVGVLLIAAALYLSHRQSHGESE